MQPRGRLVAPRGANLDDSSIEWGQYLPPQTYSSLNSNFRAACSSFRFCASTLG